MPEVFIGGVRIPLPATVPVAGQRLVVKVVEPLVDSTGALLFAHIDDTTLQLQRHWGSMEALLSALGHELNEGVNAHCDLGLTHSQISTLGEGAGPFWTAFLGAQDEK